MALKDLVASKASLSEDVIEQIISDYVRFDPDHKAIAFTPESLGLSNKARVLVYLVALQGWPYVIDEVVSVDAKPGEIEEHTGIPGGSLRPTLKELKDRKIIFEKGGRYSVRSVALPTIQAELDGNSSVPAPKRARVRSSKPQRGQSSVEAKPDTNAGGKAKKTRRGSKGGIAERFQSWIVNGYFDKPKTLADVQARFHKEAIIVPKSSLPSYLLKAVRLHQLERNKNEVNGKVVWTYLRKT